MDVNFLQIIHCNACGNSGDLKVTLEVEQKDPLRNSVKFYFCDSKCLKKWLKKHKNFRRQNCFLCLDCHGTGFAYGFKQNGVCPVCKGTKEILW